MSYRVVLQRLAQQDLDEAYLWAADRAPATASRWLTRFQAALQTLRENPVRCPLARENSKVDVELRQLLFGKRPNVYRAIFVIDGETVRILRIRRGQRRFLTRQEVDDAAKLED